MINDNDSWGINEKFLKTTFKITLKFKTHNFRNWIKLHASHHGQPPKHLKTRILKIFPSFFRNWKVYLRGSRKVRHENLCVPLTIGPSTREQVTILSHKKHKKLNFEKYSKYFSQLGHWLANESQKISVWAHNWNMRLDQPATESPEQGNTVF